MHGADWACLGSQGTKPWFQAGAKSRGLAWFGSKTYNSAFTPGATLLLFIEPFASDLDRRPKIARRSTPVVFCIVNVSVTIALGNYYVGL
jgi:hypothetical protein